MKVTAITVENIPMIKPGDDIGFILSERAELYDNDIVVVSSTIVSKSENRILSLDNIVPTEYARIISKKNGNDSRFVQAVLDESTEIFIESPFLLVLNKNGSICVNAGIDNSNVDGKDNILLLPEGPDQSARKIRDSINRYTGTKTSVLITDTNGRAFRNGQTGVAIGIAGLKPMKDWRGTEDLFGKVLEVKNEAIADEIAGFANILMGEGNGGTPVVILRGMEIKRDNSSINELYRAEKEDVIRQALVRSRSV